ncbi:sulfate adenylyltransferase subunit CysN [Acidisoma silvae]|uniref:Multifunctional fusion protein n=1 Tax=Acidisoma silvae TaxID=2802396 RepID=A0A963YPW1_9PROT|nr:sulfate adenylyltransferase subunit CysN [Acidisoma silvae]MCB8874536.1 sulfate adenylyltransferase subunit CysN [Acidisoma silvae]
MDIQNDLLSTDIEAYLRQHEHKSLLRFITCGSVDDGKSTLIGRLLYDSRMIFEDQLAALEADSIKMGTQGKGIDFALLVDGLAAEREQGITIDVAYRFFATEKRKFIVADTPGHEQYTRNMVTGASTADLAVILIDARRGVLTQTRRHSYLASLVGIRNIVLAINKMDLVNYSQDVFNRIVGDYMNFASGLSLDNIVPIPLSALAGDNITEKSGNMPWYMGQPLLAHLETVETKTADRAAAFRMPVQWVNRPSPDFRGFSGLIASGSVKPGDIVRVMPSGRESRVSRVFLDGDLPFAVAGQSVTISLADEIDCSRGDILTGMDDPVEVSDQFEVTLVWMNEAAMLPGRSYLLKLGAKTVVASVTALKHKVNVNTLEQIASKQLAMNEIGLCNLSLSQPIAFDPYEKNRHTGGFILIDRFTNETVAAGTIHFALRRAQNIHWQAIEIDRAARAAQKDQRAFVLWFTGLSGAGKSTIANIVERRLYEMAKHSTLLDGDNVRHRLNRDLGFTDGDRVENIRRVGEVARLMTDAGLIVLTSFISPFRSERQMVRELLPDGEFLEVFIDTPLALAEERDPKGLYKKARRGEIKNFTGISSPYEAPETPEIHIDTTALTSEQAADQIIAVLEQRGLLRGAAI